MNYPIIHFKERHKFEVTIDDYTAYLKYSINGNDMDIYTTFVPVAIGGRGVASELVKEAYKYAYQNSLRVIPSCDYVKIWLKRHIREESGAMPK